MLSVSRGQISPAILPLWLSCFPEESETDIRRLLPLLTQGGVLLYIGAAESPQAMGICLPCLVGEKWGYYLYALCTAPDFRGRGYLRAILDEARRMGQAEGAAFLVLIPANAALASLYARLGFREEWPLAADAKGRHFCLSCPVNRRTVFDGDLVRLYEKSAKNLSFSLFQAALQTVADTTDIFYTSTGFVVCSKQDPTRIFTADRETLAGLAPKNIPYHARSYPLTRETITPGIGVDPLPR